MKHLVHRWWGAEQWMIDLLAWEVYRTKHARFAQANGRFQSKRRASRSREAKILQLRSDSLWCRAVYAMKWFPRRLVMAESYLLHQDNDNIICRSRYFRDASHITLTLGPDAEERH